MSTVTPMRFLDAHGGTQDLGHLAATVGVQCGVCCKILLLRVAMLSSKSQMLGARAYRAPGLKYEYGHAGGAGLLVKDGRIKGRFIWGTPTCDCPKLADVEMPLEPIALPRSNYLEYGHRKEWGWHPIRVGMRIKT